MGEVTAPLEELAAFFKLGDKLHVFEDTHQWSFNGEIDAGALRNSFGPFEKLVGRLYTAYGDALSLKLKSELTDEFALTSATPDFARLQTCIADDDSPLTLDVQLDKPKLAAKLNLVDPAVATRLFLYREALVRTLEVSLTDLDRTLFDGVGELQKLILFVASDDVRLDGDYLAVIGGAEMNQWRSAIAPASESPMLECAPDKVNWSAFRLRRLTPRHLDLKVTRAAEGDSIAAALFAQLFVCSLVYIAHRSEWEAGWLFTFSSERQQTEVAVGKRSLTSAVEWRGARTLAGTARWVYEKDDDIDDRLAVVQYTVIDALKNNAAETNGIEILRLAAELEKRTRWGWEAFVAGELKKFIEQVKALEDAVAATAKDYDEQVSALTKSLTENMLAAVAFVVGSFIAAIMKTPFEAYAFIVGTSVFAVYLGLVPMRLGLRATRERFATTKANFEKRKASFAQRLLNGPVNAIVDPVIGPSEKSFSEWYARTAKIYKFVLALLIAAMIVAVPIAIYVSSGDPDDFTLTAATRNQPVQGAVTIRGDGFDRKKDIVVTLGRGVFTNAVEVPTLRVYGTSALVFTPQASDLAAKNVTVRQGRVGPKGIAVR